MIIFNYNVLSVNRFKQKKKKKKRKKKKNEIIIENRKSILRYHIRFLRYNLFTLWCHINSVLFIDITTIHIFI